MKTVLVLFLASMVVLSFIKCKSSKEYTPETFEKKKLYFGSGGGFAGTYTEYLLLENGQFFGRMTTTPEWQEFDPIPSKQTKQYFSQVDNLGLKKTTFNTPGNWSYYLTIEDGDMTNKIQWCMEAKPSDDRIVSFYKLLVNHTKELPPFKANDPVR
jgi:hypothetical protein